MLAADDIPDRCVVIATLRLPTYNPTTFDQHSVARSQVSVRHLLQELEAAAPHWWAPQFYQHSAATLPVFFFLAPFFSRWVWLELFYWAASRHVPFIYRRLRMCRETGPSPSHCSLGAGWDAAGGGGEGGFSQHRTGKRLVAVCDGARNAVKFQETGRIGGHCCMGDLGRPPVDQGIRE